MDREEDRSPTATASEQPPDLFDDAQRFLPRHQCSGAMEIKPHQLSRFTRIDGNAFRRLRTSNVAHIEVAMLGLPFSSGNEVHIEVGDVAEEVEIAESGFFVAFAQSRC